MEAVVKRRFPSARTQFKRLRALFKHDDASIIYRKRRGNEGYTFLYLETYYIEKRIPVC